jgi:hypothetical protein
LRGEVNFRTVKVSLKYLGEATWEN